MLPVLEKDIRKYVGEGVNLSYGDGGSINRSIGEGPVTQRV